MYAADKIHQELALHEASETGQVFSRLMSALEHDEVFPLHELYELSHAHFQLALELLQEWRLARHGGHLTIPAEVRPSAS